MKAFQLHTCMLNEVRDLPHLIKLPDVVEKLFEWLMMAVVVVIRGPSLDELEVSELWLTTGQGHSGGTDNNIGGGEAAH